MIEELPEGKPKLRKRGVAQPGSASALGAEGQKFESSHPDQLPDPHPVDFKSDGTRWRYQTRSKQRGETITTLPKDYVPEEPAYVWIKGIDHVAYKRDSNDWWFVDETEDFNGPWATMDQAIAALKLYLEMLN